ncbi:MAG: hypothetical protein HAW67_04260, partial [Endozoicomonadaceae bacterium]|nr:hypothetical protein [Endozoicomonadaceae bacterium]
TTFIQWLLAEAEQNLVQFGEHTMAFKLIVTHTQNLFCPSATRILKQIFADYHSKLVKPSASISKSFDSSTAFARLLQELQEIEIDGKPIKKRISQQGKIKHGQLWSYAQFMSVIQKMLNITKKEAATHFETDENYQMSKELCTGFLKQVFTILPLQLLDSDEQRVHANMMFTKAIFANGLGYVGRSLFEEMLIDESVTWEKLKNLTLPIADKDDKAWLSHKVTMKDGNTIKIIKGTDKRIAALICNEMRIFPCHAITL